MFTSPGSVLCSFLGFDIYYYGIILALAVVVGITSSYTVAKRFYDCENYVIDSSPYIILFGIIFARIYYCILDYEFYLSNPLEILAIRHGGLSIHGAVIGGIVAIGLYWMIKLKHKNNYPLSFLDCCDIYAMGLPLGQALGRWGNFFNSEAFGTPCDLPWKLFIEERFRPEEYINYSYFHPAFLYESLMDLIIFCVLFFGIKRIYPTQEGKITAYYLIMYSICRIIVESIRTDSVLDIGTIPFAKIASIIMLIIGLFLLIKKR